MTRVQFERWRRFSLGLIPSWRPTSRRRERLAAEMKWLFDFLDAEGFWPHMISWDESEKGTPYLCDLMPEVFANYYHWSEERDDEGRFYSQLSSCIRAGIDIAAEPSAGVIGFTVQDVRRAFDWHLPGWFTEQYEQDIAAAKATDGIWL